MENVEANKILKRMQFTYNEKSIELIYSLPSEDVILKAFSKAFPNINVTIEEIKEFDRQEFRNEFCILQAHRL